MAPDSVDDERHPAGASSSDNPAGDVVSASGEHGAEGTEPQIAGSVDGPDQPDGDTYATGTALPLSPISGNGPAPEPRNAKASQQLFMDPAIMKMVEIAKAQATFNIVNLPTAHIAWDVAEAARNMLRFEVPRFQPPILNVLNDPAFLETLRTFVTQSLNVPRLPLVPSLFASQQWRQLVESLPTVQHLFLAQQVAPLRDAMQQHAKFLTSIIESTTNFRGLANSFSSALQINWQQLFPNLKQLRKAVRTSLLAGFLRADLWPVPSMPVELLDKIGQLAGGGDRRPVVLAVWNYYARKNHAALEQTVAAWKDDPEYVARCHIFAAALTGHQQKLYELTIPTLLAQVEGIAGDFVHGSASPGPAPKLGKSSQIVRHAIEVAGNAGITDPDDAEMLHVVLVEAVIQHVQNVSFESSDFGAQYTDIRTRRPLNRHGTLHGIQINYPSAMNSLRCFLLLDALYALRKHAKQIAAQVAAGTTL